MSQFWSLTIKGFPPLSETAQYSLWILQPALRHRLPQCTYPLFETAVKRTKAESTVSMSPHTSFKTPHKKLSGGLNFLLPPFLLSCSSFERTLPGSSYRSCTWKQQPCLCICVCVCVCVHVVCVCVYTNPCFSLLCVVPDDYPAWQRRCNNRVEGTDNRVFLAQATSSSESTRIHLWEERWIGMQKGRDANL